MRKILFKPLTLIITFFIGISLTYIFSNLTFRSDTDNSEIATRKAPLNYSFPNQEIDNKKCQVHNEQMRQGRIEVWTHKGHHAYFTNGIASREHLFFDCGAFKLSYAKAREDLFPNSSLSMPIWFFESKQKFERDSDPITDLLFTHRFTCSSCRDAEYKWIEDQEFFKLKCPFQ